MTPGHLVREEGGAGDAALQVAPELGGDEVAEDVIVVVDRGDRHEDLGRLIRLVVARRVTCEGLP